MKKSFKTLIVFGLLAGTTAACGSYSAAMAEEAKPTADLSVAFLSQYVWRGWAFSDSSMVIQPSLTTSYKGFGVNLWGNLDTDEASAGETPGKSNFNETDLTLSYDNSYGKIGYGGGYIYYGLVGPDSQELYVNLSYDTLLSPTITVYKEITAIKGWYVNLGISHSFPMTDKIGLDLGANVGYYDDEHDYSEFHDGTLSASVSIPINEYISISPQLSWSFPLSSKAKDSIKAISWDHDSNHVYGGVSCSMSF